MFPLSTTESPKIITPGTMLCPSEMPTIQNQIGNATSSIMIVETGGIGKDVENMVGDKGMII